MTKLSETQSILLLAACQRSDRCALPLPPSLRGGSAQKVVGALLARGLLAEAEAAHGAPHWREADGRGVTLVATEAALAALGLESDTSSAGESTAAAAPGESDDAAAAQERPAGRTAPRTGKMREGTKQAQLVAMLRRDEGATIAEVVAATGWQPPTVRGALAGALKKRLGLMIDSEKVEGRGRVYRLAR
jgi:Protein of unknown function (DUF3489)